MVLTHRGIRWILFLMLALALASCQSAGDGLELFPTSGGPEVTSDPEPSPAPPRILTICLGDEPDSLFLYGDLSRSAAIIRQAIYDGPIDVIDQQASSVLLSEIPSLENGLVQVQEVELLAGQQMVDAQGNQTLLASGVVYRPAGCGSSECWQEYSGSGSILVDQVLVTFPFRLGLEWADGNPLTPEDSIGNWRAG